MNFDINSLFLLSQGAVIGIAAAVAVVLGVAGFLIGYKLLGIQRKGKISEVEKTIAKMKEDAAAECKQLKKEAILEAKEQDLKLRNEFERESKEKRVELQRMEQRLNQRDDVLNKRDTALLKMNEEVEEQKRRLDAKIA